MKHLFTLAFILTIGLNLSGKASGFSQPNFSPAATTVSTYGPIIYGCSPFQDSLWGIDTTNWSVVYRIAPSTPGNTITGMTGMTIDPTTGDCYVIMKLSAVSGRVLGKINLATGVVTQIGNLGDNFASIIFDECGQLYGATGNGASVPETLYLIDKTNATKTLRFAMGNGVDGEILCYNWDDDNMYHWSGNGTVVFEKWPISSLSYTPTNIPTTGTPSGEIFGAMYCGGNNFIISHISSGFKRMSASGAYGAANLVNLPDDLRGIVMPLNFKMPSPAAYCLGADTTNLTIYGTHMYSSIVVDWGDGDIDTVASSAASSMNHIYTAAGTYNVQLGFISRCAAPVYSAFVQSTTVTINPIPVVFLGTSSGLNVLCPGDSVTLNGNAPIGAYQWYRDGNTVPSATNTALVISTPGVYNMYVVNSFGCGDSSATSLVISSVPDPTVSLGPDAAFCAGTTLDAGNAGASFLWNDNSTSQTLSVTATGTYSVMVTDSNNCSSSDTIAITINPNPVVNLGNDTTVCGSITLDAGNAGSSYTWCDGSTTQTTTLLTSGTCNVTVTDPNGCVGSDTINFTINPNPDVNLGADVTACGSAVLDAGAGFASYLWCDNSTGQTITVNASGTCSVMVSDTNGCTASDTISYVINQNPTVTLTASAMNVCSTDANVTLTGSPAGGTFSGPGVSGNQFSPAIGTGPQVITYNYTDANGCSGTANLTINVNACVGISEQQVSAISIYPNPGTGLFNLTLTETAVVEVIDMTGQVVGSYKLNAGSSQIDGTNWAAGIYTMRAVSGNSTSTIRLVVTK